jgi:copper homeostasis protein (lipoprotein)
MHPDPDGRCLQPGGLLLLLLLAIGCYSPRKSWPDAGSESQSRASPSLARSEESPRQLLGLYVGTLPCADCRGIRTELSLYVKGANQFSDATYTLRETYLGASGDERSFESVGRWTILRGNRADPNATIYQLNPDQPRKIRNFLRISDEELRLLDRQQNAIRSQPQLFRRSPPNLVGGYAPTEANEEVQIAADFAVAAKGKKLNQEIRLDNISKAERQMVAGTNYRLCLKVSISKASQSVEAIVYRDLKGQYSLTSWTLRPC